MKRIALVACHLIRKQNLCAADAKCLVAFQRREGEFERYKGQEAAIYGIVECGECEGNRNRVVLSLATLKGALMPLQESVDAIHLGTCVAHFCPRKDDLLKAVRDKVDIEVVEGGHRYAPPKVF